MSKRNFMNGVVAFVGFTLLVSFQNCGEGFVAQKVEGESSAQTKTTYLRSLSQVLEPGRDIEFNLTSDSVSGGALYHWSHRFNGLLGACTEKGDNSGLTYVVNCSANGDLQIDLTVSDNGISRSIDPMIVGVAAPVQNLPMGYEIPMTLEFEIQPGTGIAPWNSVVAPFETFVGQTLLIKNSDSAIHQLHTSGRPCASGQPIAPGYTGNCLIRQSYSRNANGGIYDEAAGPGSPFFAVAYDGVQLYAQYCSACHGTLGSSTKSGKKPSEILAARLAQPDMNGNSAIMALTQRQIEAISYVLGGR